MEDSLVVEGVVLKLRKASRRLAFVTLRLTHPLDHGLEAAEFGELIQVVFQGEGEADWRGSCFPDGDGKRVCCGSTVRACCTVDSLQGTGRLVAEPSGDHANGNEVEVEALKKSPALASLRALHASVRDSPHDRMTESGAVRQHPAVEDLASTRAGARRANCHTQDRGSADSRKGGKQLPPVCKLWWKGKCGRDEPQDSTCWRRHYFVDDAEKEKYEKLRTKTERMQAKEREAVADDPHSQDSKATRSKSDAIFAQWLVDTFGSANLRRGRGVVDVAGGKGSVGFELVSKHAVPCTVIDPRPLRLSKGQKRAISKRRDAAGSGEDWQAALMGGEDTCRAVRDGDREEHVSKRPQEEESGGEGTRKAGGEGRGERGGGGGGGEGGGGGGGGKECHWEEGGGRAGGSIEEGGGAELCHVRGLVDDGTLDESEIGALLRASSVLIGMHPDQATEPIVNAALRYEKPFAVVPCCVFPAKFPHRRLRDGSPVVQYHEFTRYLRGLHPHVQETYLPFKGRNKVLFRTLSGEAGKAGAGAG